MSGNLPKSSKKTEVQIKSLVLDETSKFLVERIIRETHNFAIQAHRRARLKQASQSALEQIPGIGPKRKSKLLKTFGSLNNLIDCLAKQPETVRKLVGSKITSQLQKYLLKEKVESKKSREEK